MEPQNMDKRSKEYKDWKAAQQDNVEFVPIETIVASNTTQVNEISAPINEVAFSPATTPAFSSSAATTVNTPPGPVTQTVAKKSKYTPPKVRGQVSIKPFVSDEPNMGHEKYGEVLFPGTEQMDTVFCYVTDNVKTYKTGLNELAPEVQSIENEQERLAKIRYIRETVAYLENTVNNNFKVKVQSCMDNYGTEKDNFWENVTMFNSVCPDQFNNRGIRIPTYWDKLNIVLTNEGRNINMNDPHDIAVYNVLEAGGFGMVAPSFEHAKNGKYNFYLHKNADVAAFKAEPKKLKYKALGYLDTMYTGDPLKLFYMAKLMAVSGASYYRMGGETATPLDQFYEDIGNDLEGNTSHRTSKEAVEVFLKYYNMKQDELWVRTVVKDAMELRLIDIKNGQLFYLKTNSPLGKNVEDVVMNLRNPIHDAEWNNIRSEVEKIWRN